MAGELLGDLATPQAVTRLVRALPLYVRLGLGTRRRVAGVATALMAVVGVLGIGAAALRRYPAPLPDAWLVLIRQLPGDSMSGIEVPLRRANWEAGDPLDAARVGRRIPALVVRGRPGGLTAGGVTLGDSTEVDLFVVRDDQGQRQVNVAPGEGDDADRSPDGRKVALTVRSAGGGGDIAILERSTHRVSRLTFNGGSRAPRWSPDGTRLAFLHEDRHSPSAPAGRREACWITVDGSRRGCWGNVRSVLGWYDARQLLVVHSPGDSLDLLDMSTGALRGVGAVAEGRTEVSLDGRWIACFCRRPGSSRAAWYVFPTDRFDLRRRVLLPTEAPESLHVHLVSLTPRSHFIARLDVLATGDPVPPGSRIHLRVRGRDAVGAQVPVVVAEWRSLDPGVATIDSSGVLTARRPGVVRVVVSAGGWRAAARRLVIGGPTAP